VAAIAADRAAAGPAAQVAQAAHAVTSAVAVAVVVRIFEDPQALAAQVEAQDRPALNNALPAAAAAAVADPAAVVAIVPETDAVVIAVISDVRTLRKTCRRESTPTSSPIRPVSIHSPVRSARPAGPIRSSTSLI
jgi:hypothetical protein